VVSVVSVLSMVWVLQRIKESTTDTQ